MKFFEIFGNKIWLCIKNKHGFLNNKNWDKWQCITLRFYFIIFSFCFCIYVQYLSHAVQNQPVNTKDLLESIKRTSKGNQKNGPRRWALNSHQWKCFENYKPKIVKLWRLLVVSGLLLSSFKFKKMYSISIDK